ERLLVLRDGEDSEPDAREVGTGDDGVHPGQRPRALGVDAPDAGVAVRRAEEPAVRHAREEEVVGVLGLADHLRPGVDLREGLPDDRELVLSLEGAARVLAHRGTPIRRAASSTASSIFVYSVHLHRLPAG